MNARETYLLTLLTGQSQFVIPIFQRDYSWSVAECDRLLGDILAVADAPENAIHFFGSVVCVGSDHGDAVVSQRLVIDGQQRLTTCVLLLKALCCQLSELGTAIPSQDSPSALQNQYLLNPYVDRPELRAKLKLRRIDNEWLENLILEYPTPSDSQSRVPYNLDHFRTRLRALDPLKIIKGLRRLMIVSVSLSPGQDNPQLIFESLNSTGMPLTQADLVRNYVLMGHAEQIQTEWYLRYWQPLETAFGENYRSLFDNFLRDFLVLELKPLKPFRLDKVYEAFREWYPAYLNRPENRTQATELLERMARFGGYFCLYHQLQTARTHPIEERLRRLRQLVDVAAPVVMILFERMDHDKTLSEENFCNAIDVLENYVFRRSIVGAESRSGGTTFATLAGKINKEAPLASLKARLAKMGRGKEFPSDDVFFQALTTQDIYHRRNCFYMLARLTNNGKEKVSLEGLTVEHVLPQKTDLAPEWQSMLGADWVSVQQVWLHRLGNLTLTAFNSEFQAKPFFQKRDREPGGYANSPVWLNQSLSKLDSWNTKKLEERGKLLANKALKIWGPLDFELVAVHQAELEDEKDASADKALEDVQCPDHVRPWFFSLAEFARALHDEVSELPYSRSVVYRAPAWFLELIPRAHVIDVRLGCDVSSLVGLSPDAYSSNTGVKMPNSAIPGSEGSAYQVSSPEKLAIAHQLIRRAHEVVFEID